MSKIQLGPEKGTFQNKDFDIIENTLSIVNEYNKKMSDIDVAYKSALNRAEQEKQQSIQLLKQQTAERLKGNGKPH